MLGMSSPAHTKGVQSQCVLPCCCCYADVALRRKLRRGALLSHYCVLLLEFLSWRSKVVCSCGGGTSG